MVVSPSVARGTDKAAVSAASQATSEAASIANAEAAAKKAAAKKVKKQRQKTKKQQEQEAHQLQQQKQLDAHKQEVPSHPACSLHSFISASRMDSCSSITPVPAADAEVHQAYDRKLPTPAEVPPATATLQSTPPEAAGKSDTRPHCACLQQAVPAPQLQPETPKAVCHNVNSTQQTSLDSAESTSYGSKTSAQDVSRVCSQELPCCDLQHSFDLACMPDGPPDRVNQFPTSDDHHTPQLLCCPITKVQLFRMHTDNIPGLSTIIAIMPKTLSSMLMPMHHAAQFHGMLFALFTTHQMCGKVMQQSAYKSCSQHLA